MYHLVAHDLARHDIAGDAHRGYQYLLVNFGIQIIGLDCRVGKRVFGSDMNIAGGMGAKLARPEGQAGKFVKNTFCRILKAGMGNMILNIRRIQRRAGTHKPAQNPGWQSQYAALAQAIIQYLFNKVQTMSPVVQRYIAPQPPGQAGNIMV